MPQKWLGAGKTQAPQNGSVLGFFAVAPKGGCAALAVVQNQSNTDPVKTQAYLRGSPRKIL